MSKAAPRVLFGAQEEEDTNEFEEHRQNASIFALGVARDNI